MEHGGFVSPLDQEGRAHDQRGHDHTERKAVGYSVPQFNTDTLPCTVFLLDGKRRYMAGGDGQRGYGIAYWPVVAEKSPTGIPRPITEVASWMFFSSFRVGARTGLCNYPFDGICRTAQ